MMTDDLNLVREYVRDNSEAAFTALGSRHIHLCWRPDQNLRFPFADGRVSALLIDVPN
jgi:hypothetical protein